MAARRMLLLAGLTMGLVAGCMTEPLPPTLSPATAIQFPTPLPTELRNLGQNNLTAAAVPSGGALPPMELAGVTSVTGGQVVQITLGDGVLVGGALYPDGAGRRVPGVLLLAADRTTWLDLPLRLQNAGYTVLSMDVRLVAGITPLGDVTVLIDALMASSTVDPGRVAVIGGGVGADAALTGCAGDLRCDALALIGMTETAQPVAVLGYNPRPLFIVQAEQSTAAVTVGQVRADARGAVRYEEVAGDAEGTTLLMRQPTLIDDLITWLGVVLEDV